jgi:hypothetical protein
VTTFVLPPALTVILAVPVFFGVILPVAKFTAATFGLLLVHVSFGALP